MADPSSPGPAGDPGAYGRSFADVYDEWYPADERTAAAVDAIAALAGPGGRVVELGVGTGRLALPLARRGLQVSGIDASAEMLGRLAAKDPEGLIDVRLGDVADPDAWPAEPADVVVAAFNLLLNLVDEARQAATVELAARHLVPGGHLVVEAALPARLETRERRLEVREVTGAAVVLIATDADPGSGLVLGQHVELRDGQPVRLRPWRIRMVDPAAVDGWAARAGLVPAGRHADWAGAPFDPAGAGHVSRYRRPG